MLVKTDSGNVSINKRSPYGKFLLGYISTGAFSGAGTLREAWDVAVPLYRNTAKNLSWYNCGAFAGMCRNRFGRF